MEESKKIYNTVSRPNPDENLSLGKKNKKELNKSEKRFAYKILIPAVLVFLFGIFFPLIIGILISFTNSSASNGFFGDKITLINYYELLFHGGINANHFWQYTYQTLFFAIVAVTLELLLGLIFALLLNKEFKGRGLARATLLIPWALPTVASATIFRYEILAPSGDYGLFNSLIQGLGGNGIAFFGADVSILFDLPCLIPFSPGFMMVPISTTMLSSILIDVWKTTPFFSLLILAALQVVSEDLYGAADIAGATPWQKFSKITWPIIRPGVATALVFRVMDAIRVYDAIVIFRDDTVYSMTYQSVNFWSRSQEFGKASTVAMLEFLIIIIFAVFIFKILSVDRTSKSPKTKLSSISLMRKSKEGPSLTDEILDNNENNNDDNENSIHDGDKTTFLLRKISNKEIQWFRRKRVIKKIGLVISVFLMCLFCAFPFIWIVLRAFRNPYIAQDSFEILPKFPSIDAFKVVFQNSEFFGATFDRALINGFILSGLTALVVLIVGSLTGYALAKFDFKFKKITSLIIFTMTSLPPLVIIIPYFIQTKVISNIFPFLDLTDSLFGLILPYAAFNLPLATFVLRSFFEEIPEDLWKAARVDGASNFQVFRKVIMPLTVPGLFTCFILVFIAAWNELLFAQIWLISDDNHTIPRAILRFVQNPASLSANWDTDIALMAATSIATVPLVIIVLIFQKHIIKGITSGAVKG
ncbi:hypothetical protein NEF87_000549 [Candidatus Lokiarchaeum ossiferum]|uniref:ABC transmembrane type-1 domain-containing protein n=1 Tax=Candidatus Lokiarchaeum ossiferum TaxID=2951803 RepID=A0ABY6HP70_9ARCH|nr:hypothetical protein NEF87_000549 [Candidatus Lokiarchaeum sp. B-35]